MKPLLAICEPLTNTIAKNTAFLDGLLPIFMAVAPNAAGTTSSIDIVTLNLSKYYFNEQLVRHHLVLE